jgi:hypothetical protein
LIDSALMRSGAPSARKIGRRIINGFAGQSVGERT